MSRNSIFRIEGKSDRENRFDRPSLVERTWRAIVPAAILLAVLLSVGSMAPTVDDRYSDMVRLAAVGMGLRSRPTPFVAHVDYTADSAAYFGEKDLSRASLARITRALRGAGVRVIVLDLTLPDPPGPEAAALAAQAWPGLVVGVSPVPATAGEEAGRAARAWPGSGIATKGRSTGRSYAGFAPPFRPWPRRAPASA